MSDGLGFRITAEGCAWVCDGCGKEFPSGGTLHLCNAKLPEEYARLRANIATLEVDLAAERERSAVLAAMFQGLPRKVSGGAGKVWIGGVVDGSYHTGPIISAAILAAHDAEVARKAKVEALESFLDIGRDDYLGPQTMLGMEIRVRIAALKAEGGKG